jgi:hypothetical protein
MCYIYPEDSAVLLPCHKDVLLWGILEPNNDTIYINILPALFSPLHLTNLDARNRVKMVFCCFCVLGLGAR